MIHIKTLDAKLQLLGDKLGGSKDIRSELTTQIKLLFGDFYKNSANTFCYANGIRSNDYKIIHGDKESVYDLIVIEEEKETFEPNTNVIHLNIDFISNILLALESEFDGLYNVIEDFQKLLVSNAEEKVIVFRCHSTEFEAWKDTMMKHLDKYIHKN